MPWSYPFCFLARVLTEAASQTSAQKNAKRGGALTVPGQAACAERRLHGYRTQHRTALPHVTVPLLPSCVASALRTAREGARTPPGLLAMGSGSQAAFLTPWGLDKARPPSSVPKHPPRTPRPAGSTPQGASCPCSTAPWNLQTLTGPDSGCWALRARWPRPQASGGLGPSSPCSSALQGQNVYLCPPQSLPQAGWRRGRECQPEGKGPWGTSPPLTRPGRRRKFPEYKGG